MKNLENLTDNLFNFKVIFRFVFTLCVFLAFGFMFLPFWKPVLMASLFGFALVDLVERYSSNRKRTLPALLILVGFLLILVLPLFFLILKITSSIALIGSRNFSQTTLYLSIEKMMLRAQVYFEQIIDKFDLSNSDLPHPLTLVSKALSWIVDEVSLMASNVPYLVMTLFVFSLALYYFLTEARNIKIAVLRLKVLDLEELDQILAIVKKSSYRTLIVSAIIGALQGLIVASGALVFGFTEFVLIFIITFFLSFIPVIGAAPVAALLGVISLTNGSLGSFIGLLIVAGIAGSIDNLIKPYLVSSGQETSIHPIVSLLAIVGAVIVYGIPGLLLGPILMELALKIVYVFYFKEEKLPDKNNV